MDNFELFFGSNKILKSMPWIYAVFTAIYVVFSITTYGATSIFSQCATDVIVAILLFALVNAYSKKESSVMKGLMGALMAFILIHYISVVVDYWMAYAVVGSGFYIIPAGTDAPVMFVDVIVPAILYSAVLLGFAIVFCNHFAINKEHGSSLSKIRLNQVMIIVLIALNVALIVVNIINTAKGSLEASQALITFMMLIAQIAALNSVVCIETKLNAYKTARELGEKEGTWTEEKKEETKKEVFGD